MSTASTTAEAYDEPLFPEQWRVRSVTQETEDVVTLELTPQNGDAFDYRPGQFNMLYVFGTGEVPISISGDAAGKGELVHTIRDVGTVTHAICTRGVGDVVGVRGPFGRPWPIDQTPGGDVLVVAGGIGLAPLRPVVYELIRRRDQFDDVVLLYGARRPEELLFLEEIASWRRHGIQVEVTVDHAGPSWPGHMGVVTTLIRLARFDARRATAFLCGPEVMMRFCGQELAQRGVAAERTFVSMERNMKCAVGFCGHCQLGSHLLCVQGPVFAWPEIAPFFDIREL